MKEFENVVREQAIQDALASGVPIDQVEIETEPWEWTKEGCDPEIDDDCDFGLEEAPPEIISATLDSSASGSQKSKVVYEDCN